MPGNQIAINGVIEYYVGDSKMDELLAWLDNNGIKQEAEANAQNESADTK
jgi:hypothetical protein